MVFTIFFDLGEFHQKGTVRTKYGFKEDYLQAIQALKAQGINHMGHVVLNHKAAADQYGSLSGY